MPLLLQLAQSYNDPESLNYKIAYLREQMERGFLQLGDLAYADQVQLAMLGDTIIVGGYLRTDLIAARSILAEHLNIETLSAITANLGTVRAGLLQSLNYAEVNGLIAQGLKIDLNNGAIYSTNLIINGALSQYNLDNGYKSLEINYNQVRLFDWTKPESYIGSLGALVYTGTTQPLVGLWSANENIPIAVGYRNQSTGNISFWYTCNKDGFALMIPVINTVFFESFVNFASVASFEDYVSFDGETVFWGQSYFSDDVAIGGEFMSGYKLSVTGATRIQGNFQVTGSKNRIVETGNFGEVLMNAYETARPTFADVGHAKISDDGLCYIDIDPVFYETIDHTYIYRHFLTKYGAGDLWVKESTPTYFIVEGTPGLEFDWKVEAIQKGYNGYNMERLDLLELEDTDYIKLADQYLKKYERELMLA